MTKLEFLFTLHDRLNAFPRQEVEERLRFYSEMIEDRMEEGLSEEESVAAVGSVDQIAAQIAADLPAAKKEPKKRLNPWEIVLLVLGSPVWLSLLISVAAVVFSVYVSIWAVLISLWAVFGSLVACAFGVTVCGIGAALDGSPVPGIVMVAAAMVCSGLSVFLFWGCKLATSGTVLLTKKAVLLTVRHFTNKEAAA